MISDIKMAVTRGYVGRQVAVLVWNMTGMPPTPDQVVASTDTLLYDSDDADTLLLPMSGGLTNLPAGRYAFTAIEFDSVLQIAQTDEIFTFSTGWIIWPTSPFGTWANPEDFGQNFAKPFVIRPILSGGEIWYLDADNDGWYAATQFVTESPGPGWTNVPPVNGGGDCDDSDPDEFPGQTWYIDADNDGYSNSSVIQCERPANGFLISEINGTSDCADNDPAIHPAAMEICDGMDNNCDAIIDDQIPSGSSYYIPISLNNPGDPQMNYQVPIEINSLNLINAGHMQADGDDIRFAPINSCEGPFLDYFIESGINTTNTLIWVKIPMLPSGNSTVYLYYGDTEAEAGSNFNATFPNALITNGTNNTLSGTQNYDWLELSAGDTIFITPGSPLVMNARRAIIDGDVWGKGRGYAASGLSMSGAGPGGGALSTFGMGGGAGGGADGGAGGTGGIDPGDASSAGGQAHGTTY